MFQLLWHDKPDKISREQIWKDYSKGGFKIIQLDYFIKALKSTRVHRIIWDFHSPFESINILEYYRMKILVKSFLKKQDSPLKDKIIRPLLPSDIKIWLKNVKRVQSSKQNNY